jgi:hypothetical protein
MTYKNKNSIIKVAKHVIEDQTYTGSTDSNSLDSLLTLLKILINCEKSEEKNDEIIEFQKSILETIDSIAEKNENSSQNIEILNSIFSFNKKFSKGK